jgi:hypothetical protein
MSDQDLLAAVGEVWRIRAPVPDNLLPAIASSRAAILTPSPIRSPSLSSTTSPK